jgi:hypothetical protein
MSAGSPVVRSVGSKSGTPTPVMAASFVRGLLREQPLKALQPFRPAANPQAEQMSTRASREAPPPGVQLSYTAGGKRAANCKGFPFARRTATSVQLPSLSVREWRRNTWLGLAMGAISVTAVAVDVLTPRLHAWMPNVATSAATVGLTVTLIDSIVRRESRDRLAPLLGPPLSHINVEFGRFVAAVAEDYAATHIEAFRPIPTDPLAVLDLWLEEQDNADRSHPGLEDGTDTLRDMGREFALQVAYHEEQLGPVMDPELRAALRSFSRTTRHAEYWQQKAGHPQGVPPEIARQLDPERNSYRTYVMHARALGEVLRRHAKAPVLFELQPMTIEWAEQHREQLLNRSSD